MHAMFCCPFVVIYWICFSRNLIGTKLLETFVYVYGLWVVFLHGVVDVTTAATAAAAVFVPSERAQVNVKAILKAFHYGISFDEWHTSIYPIRIEWVPTPKRTKMCCLRAEKRKTFTKMRSHTHFLFWALFIYRTLPLFLSFSTRHRIAFQPIINECRTNKW